MSNIAFIASDSQSAQESLVVLEKVHGNTPIEKAEIIVALGGDGFMLEALHSTSNLDCPVYGMNRGTVGFLMNEYSSDNLLNRLSDAEEAVIHPLKMLAKCTNEIEVEALAINEVSLIRAGAQAAKLQISVDGRIRLPELVCDGALLSTPAGSTAYNYSAHGPILPIGAEILAMTAMSAFRPRREYSPDNLLNRLSDAEEAVIHPLKMLAKCTNDIEVEALAINEVSLIRAGAQAAKLQISVDGRIRLPELVCDGALLSTPAGSTAYNYSAHGPILPIGAEILAMTAMSAFRPRRWRGALLPESAHVRIDVLESEKRPVTASADSKKAYDILSVDIFSAPDHKHRILFDPGHGLEERLLREQFV